MCISGVADLQRRKCGGAERRWLANAGAFALRGFFRRPLMRYDPGVSPGIISILYEDNHIIAVNKAPADIVQGDRTGNETLADKVKDYIRASRAKPGEVFLGVPHRLDRPTSGVVLFARTSKALERLSAMFRNGEVAKTYWALVGEKPPAEAGTLTHWLTRNSAQNKSYAWSAPRPGAQEARLSYRMLFSLERYHLVKIELETGRHHQIRAQLHAIGCHIKGDLKYGAARSNPGGGIHLHARRISFLHPVKKVPVEICADPPRDALWDAALSQWKLAAAASGPPPLQE